MDVATDLLVENAELNDVRVANVATVQGSGTISALANVSIGALFISGIGAGAVFATTYSAYCVYWAVRNKVPRSRRASAREVLKAVPPQAARPLLQRARACGHARKPLLNVTVSHATRGAIPIV